MLITLIVLYLIRHIYQNTGVTAAKTPELVEDRRFWQAVAAAKGYD